jgi:hypothetical protein
MSEDLNAAQHPVARVDRKSNLFGSADSSPKCNSAA